MWIGYRLLLVDSSSTAASDAHAGVRLVLSATDTTDTKAVELKSLQDDIEHELQKRREVLALLHTEGKALNERMQALASQSLSLIDRSCQVSHRLSLACVSGRQVRRHARSEPRARDQNMPDWSVWFV
jgi:hypothetical protein